MYRAYLLGVGIGREGSSSLGVVVEEEEELDVVVEAGLGVAISNA